MPTDVVRYPRYRLPAAIISHAVWLDYRFVLSFRDVEDLLALRGITVSYESIRRWCETFGAAYARRLRHRAGPLRPHLASRRTVRDDPRPAPLPLAGRRPGWRGHRRPAAAASRSPCCCAFSAETAQVVWPCAP